MQQVELHAAVGAEVAAVALVLRVHLHVAAQRIRAASDVGARGALQPRLKGTAALLAGRLC